MATNSDVLTFKKNKVCYRLSHNETMVLNFDKIKRMQFFRSTSDKPHQLHISYYNKDNYKDAGDILKSDNYHEFERIFNYYTACKW